MCWLGMSCQLEHVVVLLYMGTEGGGERSGVEGGAGACPRTRVLAPRAGLGLPRWCNLIQKCPDSGAGKFKFVFVSKADLKKKEQLADERA